MERLKFYTVRPDYLKYLKLHDPKIVDNLGPKQRRPYIGILLKVNNLNYLAPLTSPKVKHLKMKDNLDFIRIDKGSLGAINLNNMFPVHMRSITEKNLSLEEDLTYKSLLENQLTWCNLKKIKIQNSALKLYENLNKYGENSRYYNRCCNFKLLEEKCRAWEKAREKVLSKKLRPKNKGIIR